MSTVIKLVCATRASAAAFATDTALGRCLPLYRWPFVQLRLFPSNTAGLAALYNSVLRECETDPAIVVFVHDDVHLLDFFWPERIVAGLAAFDLIGVAGNRRRLPRQPGWLFVDAQQTRDAAEHLSGVVAHGTAWPPSSIDYYGPPGVEVRIIDGVLMAAHSETLRARGLTFDTSFDFHFYDVDFCRQAEAANLRMGTWPIQLMHESVGDFRTPAWHSAYAQYLAKWRA
jgi:hypothetical protein